MNLIKPSFFIESIPTDLELIERAGRTCYKSEESITEDSSKKFISMILRKGHESVLEHLSMTVRFICDRGVTHELVRHRLCAFSQESTRYCNYKGGVTFIIPPWVPLEPGEYGIVNNLKGTTRRWFMAMIEAEEVYIGLISLGWTPQQARSVLPNALKTEIVVTANMREWRHIFKLRTSKAAHPQMREIMVPLLASVKREVEGMFDDIKGDSE